VPVVIGSLIIWDWLVGANARRKNMERALRSQQRKNEDLRKKLFKVGWDLGTALLKIRDLEAENAFLESRNRHLAGELTSELLTSLDREGVTKGLTRKL
jgi:predicted nuclease with TOPRIM domain